MTAPEYVRQIVAQVAEMPVWERTEKEQRIMTLYELKQARRSRRPRPAQTRTPANGPRP